MNEKERQKAESRERILGAAAELFRTKGFTATGIDELMSAADLTAGAFYAHFKSKKDLFDRTLEHILKTNSQRLTQGLDFKGGEKMILELLSRYVSEIHRDKPELGCAIPAIANEIARHSKKSKEAIGDYIERWTELFARNLSQGTPAERRQLALQLISQAIGSVLLARITPEEFSKEVLSAGKKLR
jgi:TetR/AcrR family transcriptional repressor of nem operon